MKNDPRSPIRRSLPKRRLLAAGLMLGMLASAAFGVTAATAAAPPTLEPLRISAGGHEATVDVRASEPVTISHSLTEAPTGPRVVPIRGLLGRVPDVRPGGGTAATPDVDPVLSAAKRFKLTGLKSNTTYTLDVRATNGAGQFVTVRESFTTLKQRVRITLDTIVVHNDGDDGLFLDRGDGEPLWGWQVQGFAGGPLKDCFPKAAGRCQEGSFGEGTIVPTCTRGERDHRACPYSYIFAEENFQPIVDPTPQPGSEDFASMPQRLKLYSYAKESDGSGIFNCLWDGCEFGGGDSFEWQVPAGVESATAPVTLKADDLASSPDFKSTMHFTFQLFYDNQSYPPNVGRVSSTSQ